VLKSHQRKSNHRVPRSKEVDTYGAQVFAPDYSATVLAAKMCTNTNEHSMYIRFLCMLSTWMFIYSQTTSTITLTFHYSLVLTITRG